MYRIICLFACIAYVVGDVAGGRNQYLPPDKGYNYDRPNVGFPSAQQPNQIPASRPQQPRPQPPAYIPPAPQRPVSRPQPVYQPPQQTGYPSGPAPSAPHEDHVHTPGMPFDFNYAVNDVETANDYSHKATSDGDVTRGEYRIALPDGRTQIVRYTADWKNGYNAEVTYEGEAQYPEGPAPGSNNGGYKY